MANIMVVDDDASIRKLISLYLKSEGFTVWTAADGIEALELLEQKHVDLMIVDIMMPGIDGYVLTEKVRETDAVMPVLMVTAKQALEDKRKGFRVGTDDYMVKPVDLDEMLLRVEALLRRARINNERKIEIGSVVLDSDTQIVSVGNREIQLPNKEFLLLFKLLSYPQQIFTRQQLMDDIWGIDSEADDRTVDVHIKRLRDKFDHVEEFSIVTIRGLGYKVDKKV